MVKQIRTFAMSKMTIGSCKLFHDTIYKYIQKATPAKLHIETLEPAYKKALDTLSSIVNRQRSFIATANLADTDKVRDNAVGVINSVVNAYRTSPVSEKRNAARLLYPQLTTYRGIGQHEYSKETAEVKGMLEVLSAEANTAAVTALGLDAEVEALREANEAFAEALESKGKEMNKQQELGDMKSDDVTGQANSLYEQIVQMVNAYAIVQPTDEINTFIDDVNGTVGVYADIAGSGSSASGVPSGGDGGGESPDPIIPGGDDDGESPDPIV